MKNLMTLKGTQISSLSQLQMRHVKGGNNGNASLPAPLTQNPNDLMPNANDVAEGLDDDKRRTRPGGGGVTTS